MLRRRLAMGPLAGRLATPLGYGRILRLGPVGAVGAVVLTILLVDSQSAPCCC
jgi:hypothetical protein